MKKMYLAVVLLASLVLGACSDDKELDRRQETGTEETYSEAPVWQVDWHYNQERPNWQKPDGSLYQNWTTIMVQIEDALKPYVSKDDLMALFVNGELRGLAKPAVTVGGNQTGSTKFLMKVYGNETGTETVNASLQYYCQTLKHLFTLSDRISMDSDESTGIDDDYVPQFTLGSAKYPVQTTVNVEPILLKAGFTPTQGSLVGVFVGNECCGTATLTASGITPIVIYGRSKGESLTLKYYDAVKGVIYTIHDAVNI
jgi:hypothetical protein